MSILKFASKKGLQVKKATNEQLIKAYEDHKNVWKVAELFGMCGQSVWERLKRLGIDTTTNFLSDAEKNEIKALYEEGFISGDGSLKNLSLKLNKTIPFISRYAKQIGLTNRKRSKDNKICDHISNNNRNWLKENPHPKGMLGKKHSAEFIEKSLNARKKALESKVQYQKMVETQRNNGAHDRKHGSWKSEWRTIGNQKKFFRSRWEANYARYLEFLRMNGNISGWEHEPKTFWFLSIKRGARSYLPDFKVINQDGSHYWVEVKGWMDKRSKTKIKRFAKYYPEEKLEIVGVSWFKKNAPILRGVLNGWEG